MENKFSLRIYSKAAEDMEGIFDYIYNTPCAPAAAAKQIADFESALNTVCHAPLSCPLVNNEYVSDGSLRKLIVNNYIVFYRPDMEQKTVDVVRVLYGMMNFKDIL